MKEKEILQEIIEWLGNDTSYLSTRTDYALLTILLQF